MDWYELLLEKEDRLQDLENAYDELDVILDKIYESKEKTWGTDLKDIFIELIHFTLHRFNEVDNEIQDIEKELPDLKDKAFRQFDEDLAYREKEYKEATKCS